MQFCSVRVTDSRKRRFSFIQWDGLACFQDDLIARLDAMPFNVVQLELLRHFQEWRGDSFCWNGVQSSSVRNGLFVIKDGMGSGSAAKQDSFFVRLIVWQMRSSFPLVFCNGISYPGFTTPFLPFGSSFNQTMERPFLPGKGDGQKGKSRHENPGKGKNDQAKPFVNLDLLHPLPNGEAVIARTHATMWHGTGSCLGLKPGTEMLRHHQ